MPDAFKILTVDDSAFIRKMVASYLPEPEFDVHEAGDGQEALDLVKKGNVSLIITDMRMPNMTGLELLKKVKEDHPKLPVVLISGYSMGVMEDQTYDLKPDGFLGKPLSMSEVEKMLNTLL